MTAARARLFVALDLPDDVRAGLGAWAAAHLASRAQLRVVPTPQLHVTLCFLGWRDEHEVAAIGAATEGCGTRVRDLELAALAWLPARRPRVLAVDVADPLEHLAALQRRLSGALAGAVGHEPERRAFRPHVTVARVRSAAQLRAQERPVPDPPALAPFAGAVVTLYRSHPSRGGASYEALTRAHLPWQ